MNEVGKTVRKRVAVTVGSLEDIPEKKIALQKLAAILQSINDIKRIPKKMMTFSGFIEKYRSLS